MTARERGPERLGNRIQRRSNAVEQLLEAVGQEILSEDHDHQQRHCPPVRSADVLDEREDGCEHDDQLGVTEVSDPAQPSLRDSSRVVGAPLGDACIEIDKL